MSIRKLISEGQVLRDESKRLFRQSYSDKHGKYNIGKLHQWITTKGIEPQQIPIKQLLWSLTKGHSDEELGSKEFVKRAEKSKMFPIIALIKPERPGKLSIADGRHRVYKAWKRGDTHISGYVLHRYKLPKQARVSGI